MEQMLKKVSLGGKQRGKDDQIFASDQTWVKIKIGCVGDLQDSPQVLEGWAELGASERGREWKIADANVFFRVTDVNVTWNINHISIRISFGKQNIFKYL